MENNAALFVDSLLARFGTTMDRLMPAIIDFGRYECRHTIRWELIFALGLVAVIICVLLIIMDLATLQKWYDFPEVMAYKYIFGLMR